MEKKKFVLEKETQLQRWSVALDREGARQRRVARSPWRLRCPPPRLPPRRQRFVWPSPNGWRRRTTRRASSSRRKRSGSRGSPTSSTRDDARSTSSRTCAISSRRRSRRRRRRRSRERGERAELEDKVRAYKNEIVTLTAELAPVRAEHAAKTTEIKAWDERIERLEAHHEESACERRRATPTNASPRLSGTRERAREREEAENAAADAAVARARRAIADVDERTRRRRRSSRILSASTP